MHERVDAIVAIDTYALHAPGLDPVLVLSLMCANLPDDGVTDALRATRRL